MTVERKRTTRGVMAGLASVGLIVAFLGARVSAAPDAPPSGPKAGATYKNIQVLKDLPASQLMPVMQQINVGLGVRCGFCHDRAGFDSDAKPAKKVARQMMVMTQDLYLHQKPLHGKVSCYMCHHGHASPQLAPDKVPGGPGGGR